MENAIERDEGKMGKTIELNEQFVRALKTMEETLGLFSSWARQKRGGLSA